MPQIATTPTQAVTAEIRAQLARKQRTVADLAVATGLSEATLYRRLRDGSSWSLEEVTSIAEFFGMTFWQFLRLTMEANVA